MQNGLYKYNVLNVCAYADTKISVSVKADNGLCHVFYNKEEISTYWVILMVKFK